MSTSTSYVAVDKRITQQDYRTPHLSGMPGGEETSNSGWTWVAAIAVAALFIVSGYLDQESRMLEGSSTSAATEKYAANNSATQAPGANASTAERQSEKGY